jgi:hypothetical protein
MMNPKQIFSLALVLGAALSVSAHAVENKMAVSKSAMMGKEGDDKGGGKKGMLMMGKEGDDKGGGKKGMLMMGKEGDDKGGGKKGMLMMGKEGDDKGGGKKGMMMTPSSTVGIEQNAMRKGTLMNKGGQAAPASGAMGSANELKGVEKMQGIQK